LARLCLAEIGEKMRKGKEMMGWEEERRQFWEDGGRWVDWERRGRESSLKKLEKWDRKKERKGREMGENKKYEILQVVPTGKRGGNTGVLGKDWEESRWRRVARFRLGNEMREGRYWEEEKNRLCRLWNKLETWEHVWEEYRS